MQEINSLAIGGGPYFQAEGWYNLEEVVSRYNPEPFVFSPDCVFPFGKGSIRQIYSSHCLEHLNQPTVLRVLSESFRVLAGEGKIIIALPDFDMVLQRWRDGDDEFFNEIRWGLGNCIPTWKNRGIVDCIDYRAALIFCGFWNEAYGNHFADDIKNDSKAYHGPPVLPKEKLLELRDSCTPSELSHYLRKAVLENEKSLKFNHQTAWSRKDFCHLLESAGFEVITDNKEFIIHNYSSIPKITEMVEISMYFVAKKKNG